MRIVQLNCYFLREVLPVFILLAKPPDDVLEGTGYEKILLQQPEFLPAFGIVIRIEDFGDGLAVIFLADGFFVSSMIEACKSNSSEARDSHSRRKLTVFVP